MCTAIHLVFCCAHRARVLIYSPLAQLRLKTFRTSHQSVDSRLNQKLYNHGGGQRADVLGDDAVRSSCTSFMSPRDQEEKSHVVMLLTSRGAHPLRSMRWLVWVQLPQEDPRSTEEDVCGLLLRCLYGLRDADMNFEQLWAPGHGQYWLHLWPVVCLYLRVTVE